MTRPQTSVSTKRALGGERRSHANWAAFLVGLPLAAGLIALIQVGLLRNTPAQRYVSHPVEYVEVIMFCGALGALGVKFLSTFLEQRACRTVHLSPWDGRAVPVSEAATLLTGLQQLPRRLQNTWIVQRSAAVLHFLCSRGSATELDDQLRSLADADALALEGSFALIRFITWAVPILGFLGTVLGITQSISGITPEKLENSLSDVTDGLALAFDATALALGLTMLTMFLSFIVERAEQAVLDAVDRYAERELAHRFQRTSPVSGEFIEVVRAHTDILVQGVEQLVQRQAVLWSQTLQETDQRRQDDEKRLQDRLTAALETALERTLETHSRRLLALEQHAREQSVELANRLTTLATAVRETSREQQTSLAQVSQGVAGLLENLAHLQDGDKQLRRLQETLSQNLAALAGTGTFEQALHSLTAAVHLLTARATPTPGSTGRIGPRPGTAA
jgi:biopolymer transport protein ExbB/TolQ